MTPKQELHHIMPCSITFLIGQQKKVLAHGVLLQCHSDPAHPSDDVITGPYNIWPHVKCTYCHECAHLNLLKSQIDKPQVGVWLEYELEYIVKSCLAWS